MTMRQKAVSFQISHTGAYTIVGKEDAVSLAQAADTEHSRSPILLFDSDLSASSVCRCVFPKEEAKIRWYLLR